MILSLSVVTMHKPCSSLEQNMDFVVFLKSKLLELEKFGYDFTIDGSPGEALFSYIVRSKLYPPFLKELSRKSDRNYPSMNEITGLASSLYKLLKPGEPSTPQPNKIVNVKATSEKLTFSKPIIVTPLSEKPIYEQKPNSDCKFCSLTNPFIVKNM